MTGTLSGERGEAQTPRVCIDFSGLGSLEAVTEEGLGYKLENEDAVAWVKTPEGDIVLMDFDGVGGHAHGKEAANLAAEKMVELLASGHTFEEAGQSVDTLIRQTYPEAGAAFAGIQIRPSTRAGHPHLAQVHWAGDARVLILRKNSDRQWSWIYRSSDDSWAKDVVDCEIDQGTKDAIDRTKVISLHPMGNIITNGFGQPGYHLNSTSGGELPSSGAASPGYRRAEGLEAVELLKGDLVLLFSDGVGDNYLETRHLMRLLETAENESDAVDLIYNESMYKMQLLQEANGSQAFIDGGRFSFTYEGNSPFWRGRNLWIDHQGKVFDAQSDGEVVDKAKADNISLMVLYVSEGEVARSKGPSQNLLVAWVRSMTAWISSRLTTNARCSLPE